jgi:hypothetical protein
MEIEKKIHEEWKISGTRTEGAHRTEQIRKWKKRFFFLPQNRNGAKERRTPEM